MLSVDATLPQLFMLSVDATLPQLFMLSVDATLPQLFIHAFGGCDTISAVHDKGKGAVLRLIQKSKRAQQLSAVFTKLSASQKEIGRAVNELFILLYVGKAGDSLQILRHPTYMKMIFIFSNCQWKTCMDCAMDPLEWGWKMENRKMTPIMTDQIMNGNF